MYKVKKGVRVSSSDLWYDIIHGGYIDPEEILENEEDIKEVNNAIKVLIKFEESCNEQIEGFMM